MVKEAVLRKSSHALVSIPAGINPKVLEGVSSKIAKAGFHVEMTGVNHEALIHW